MATVKRRTLSATAGGRADSAKRRGAPFDKALFHKRNSNVQSLNTTFVDTSAHSRKPPLTTKEGRLVSKLKNRKEAAVQDDISSELAAKVVKRFILPMFEADTRQQNDRMRSAAFGLAKKRDFSIESGMGNLESMQENSTVYGELKLSEQLSIEMLRQKEEVMALQGLLTDALQEKSQIYADYAKAKQTISRMEAAQQSLAHQLDETEKELHSGKLLVAVTSHNLQETQRLFRSLQDEKNQLQLEMHAEKAFNDIRFD